jgi:hypothetical protein
MKVTKINIDASIVSTISTTADSIKEEQENNLSQKEHIYIYIIHFRVGQKEHQYQYML